MHFGTISLLKRLQDEHIFVKNFFAVSTKNTFEITLFNNALKTPLLSKLWVSQLLQW